MKVRQLGHVVVRVRDQGRAEAFYGGLLGMRIVARNPDMKMTFFSLGNHHDFAVVAGADGPSDGPAKGAGLFHVAFKIGDSLDDLREAKAALEAAGVNVEPIEHGVTKSLYFDDPDGNTVELYVDCSDAWKRDPQLVAHAEPMQL
jgi:catechol 2,3-dioxygenase